MAVLFWILGIVGGLVLLVWGYIVWLTWRFVRTDIRSVIRELSHGETCALVENVPQGAAYASRHEWPLDMGLEYTLHNDTNSEVSWVIEEKRRYFSALHRNDDAEKCSFATFLRSKSTRVPVLVISTNNWDSLEGAPQSGVLVEVFRGDDLNVLHRRHEHAVRYTSEAGDCEVAEFRRPILAWVLELAEQQQARARRNPMVVLVLPFSILYNSIVHYNRPIERRFPPGCKTMRRLRGEIMHSPRGYA